ncbi:MAG TPA: STAS domain-containing protein [Solirubrobacterales bacterium]|nr:STAS domain-containing protein [Solirubrobacterales bacterium]
MLRLTQRQLPDGATEIEVDGELALSVADRLQMAIDEAGPGSTLIDLRYCTFIDSTGIAVILRAHQEREEEGGRVVVHSLSSSVLRIFTVTGLTESALVFTDRDDAGAPDDTDAAVGA